MVSSVVEEQPLDIGAVMNILDETRQVITYSREREKATTELQAANEQLKDVSACTFFNRRVVGGWALKKIANCGHKDSSGRVY